MQRDTHKKKPVQLQRLSDFITSDPQQRVQKKKKEINRSTFKENKGSNEER